jgi:hypothetical protein
MNPTTRRALAERDAKLAMQNSPPDRTPKKRFHDPLSVIDASDGLGDAHYEIGSGPLAMIG